MKDGDILQYDTPENILNNPSDDFVSSFVGRNRIWSSPEYIKVSDIMIENPVTAFRDLTVLKCIDKMRQNKVDSLLIVERGTRQLAGIVKAGRLRGVEDRSRPAEEYMYEDFPSLLPEQSILDALKIVTENHVSTVPVVDEQKRLMGLITRSSLVTTLSQQYFDYEGGEL
jgi:osmoprotectant transport system ATP-binding protein